MKAAALPQQSQQARESLRERKKRLTREAIFTAAQALFSERGFDDVTVAEIADAANISVKTLFTYIGAKEELLFSGRPAILGAVVEAVASRRLGQTPLVAAGQALLAAVDDKDPDKNLDAFLRVANGGAAALTGRASSPAAGSPPPPADAALTAAARGNTLIFVPELPGPSRRREHNLPGPQPPSEARRIGCPR